MSKAITAAILLTLITPATAEINVIPNPFVPSPHRDKLRKFQLCERERESYQLCLKKGYVVGIGGQPVNGGRLAFRRLANAYKGLRALIATFRDRNHSAKRLSVTAITAPTQGEY